jgi:hypothetical protein
MNTDFWDLSGMLETFMALKCSRLDLQRKIGLKQEIDLLGGWETRPPFKSRDTFHVFAEKIETEPSASESFSNDRPGACRRGAVSGSAALGHHVAVL